MRRAVVKLKLKEGQTEIGQVTASFDMHNPCGVQCTSHVTYRSPIPSWELRKEPHRLIDRTATDSAETCWATVGTKSSGCLCHIRGAIASGISTKLPKVQNIKGKCHRRPVKGCVLRQLL